MREPAANWVGFRSANQNSSLIDYVGISNIFGVVISKNLATLKELEEYYSLEDVYLLADIVKVNNYNEWVVMKDLNKN